MAGAPRRGVPGRPPDIDLRLHASEEIADLAAGAADLAIRYGSGASPGLIAEPFGVDRIAPVASPRLGLSMPDDLRSTTLIHFEWHRSDLAHPTWQSWLREAGLRGVDARAGLRFTDESHAIQAAIAGHGVALLSLVLVAEDLAAGILVAPFGPEIEGPAFHLVRAADRPESEAVAAVRDWLLSEAQGPASPSPVAP